MPDRKILLIDGNNAAWRMIKRLPALSVKGQDIQMVYGFLRMIRSVIEQFEPNVVLVIWDDGHSEYRKKIFPAYKGNRGGDEDHIKELTSLNKQKIVLNSIFSLLNIPTTSWPGTEADDIIGICSTELEGDFKTIVSADMDMLHLVDEDVQVWSPMKSILYTHKNFRSRIGDLSPEQHLEMKALIGDPSDNIPGVAKGFGEVTARELLKRYGSINTLYTSTVEKKVSKMNSRYNLLYSEGAREIAYRNLMLMDLTVCGENIKEKSTLLTMIKKVLNNRNKIDKSAVKRVFLEKAFNSLLKDFGSWITPFETLDWRDLE